MNNSNLKLFFILILIFISTLFVGQNTQIVTINVFLETYSMPVSIVVVSTLLIGILIGWFFKGNSNNKQKKTIEPEDPEVSG